MILEARRELKCCQSQRRGERSAVNDTGDSLCHKRTHWRNNKVLADYLVFPCIECLLKFLHQRQTYAGNHTGCLSTVYWGCWLLCILFKFYAIPFCSIVPLRNHIHWLSKNIFIIKKIKTLWMVHGFSRMVIKVFISKEQRQKAEKKCSESSIRYVEQIPPWDLYLFRL